MNVHPASTENRHKYAIASPQCPKWVGQRGQNVFLEVGNVAY